MIYFKYDLHIYNHETWKQEVGDFICLSRQLSLGLKLLQKNVTWLFPCNQRVVEAEESNGVHFKWPFTSHLNIIINENDIYRDSQCMTIPDSHFGPFCLLGDHHLP